MANLPRFIGTDIDGTAFSRESQRMLPHTFDVLSKCVDMGSVLVPVTGRVLSMVPVEKFPKVRYVISSNGAYIYDVLEQRAVRARYIERDDIIKFWTHIKPYVREYRLGMEIFENGVLVIERELYENLSDYADVLPNFHYAQIEKGAAKIVESYDIYLEEEGNEIIKVNFPGKTVKKFPAIKDIILEADILKMTSDGLNMECGPKGCNKGEAIWWLCDYLNIPRESTMAFGDGNNDLEMLLAVHYGVAMGNALDSVKEAAPYTTIGNEEDGIAHFIETHFEW